MNGYDKNNALTLSGLVNGNYDDVISNTAEITTLTVNGVNISGTTNSLQSQINAINTILTGCLYSNSLLTMAYSLKVTGSLTFVVNGANLLLSDFYTGTNSSIATANTNINTANNNINTANSNITTLTNKTTDISYTPSTTTIANTTVLKDLTFTGKINSYTLAEFTNSVNYTSDLTANAQTQINNINNTYPGAISSAVATGCAGAVTASATAAGIAITAAINAQKIIQTAIDVAQDDAIALLQGKTTQISYSAATTTTTIDGAQLTTNTISATDINYTGGIVQTGNNANTFRAQSYFQSSVEIQNNSGLLVDYGSTLQTNGDSKFGVDPNHTNTTMQIGTNSASILNNYSSSNFYGPVVIRNNSTSSSGSISPYLNVSSIVTNTNARKMQGICVGVEQLLANEANCNIGYNFISNANTGNYGYLGLNVGSFNVYESIRWSPAKVTISNGSFETSGAAQILGDLTSNVIKNSGTVGMSITSTGLYNMVLTSGQNLNLFANSGAAKLNSNDIQIGSNQAGNVNNTISIGTTNSGSVCNIPNGVKTNNITPFNTANSMSINGLTINIGCNESILPPAINVINIGAVASASIINLSGIVYSTFPINTTSIFSQF